MTRRPVAVCWIDACSNSGYDKHGLVNMNSVGWLVYEDGEYIALAQDYMDSDGTYRNSMSIPKVNIKSIAYLRRASSGHKESS